MLNKERIIEICSEYLPTFKNSIKRIKYELKGIFNSELLLFISLTKYFGVNLIIESGRANGYSTKIIAENFKDNEYKIKSIEILRYNPEVRVSYERLKYYRNLELLFGNSKVLLPKLITEECCILIDGPKAGSINLAIKCLNNPLVKAVFVHDLHKDSSQRSYADTMFTNSFFTDDKDYVEKFKFLDENCWLEIRKDKKYNTWAPYKRDNKIQRSYFSTLSVFLNSDNPFSLKDPNFSIKDKKNLKRYWSLKYFLDGWNLRIKRIIKFPIHYIYFERVFNLEKGLSIKNLLKNWYLFNYQTFRELFKKRAKSI